MWLTTQLGDRLRAERKRLGLSQADAALLGGVRREMWSAYETNTSLPNAEVLLHLVGTGWDLSYLLGGSRILSESNLADHEHALLDGYRSLDEEGQAAVRRAVQLESMRARAADAPGPAAARKRPRGTRS